MIFCKGSFSHELVVNTVLPFCFLVSTEEFTNTQNAFAYRHRTQLHSSIQPVLERFRTTVQTEKDAALA